MKGLVARFLYLTRRWEEPLTAYVFITPSALLFLVFVFIPAFSGLYLSFTSWDGIGASQFIGIQNYVELYEKPLFWKVLGNTLYYTFAVVLLQMSVAFILALALNSGRLRLKGVFRTAYFLPVLTSTVAASVIWRWLFSEEGFLGYAINLTGLCVPGGWLADPRFAMPALILMSGWRWAGYLMVIYLAGLQAIPSQLYDASAIDGAGAWAQFRFITWPMLSFTTFFIFVTSIIGSFQVFDQIYVMTGGGPLDATNCMGYYLYENAFKYFRMGYANAIGVITAVIILILTIIQFKIGARYRDFAS